MFSKSLIVAVLLALVATAAREPVKKPTTGLRAGGQLIELNENNWKLMFQGEWMIAFHAPGCRACEDLAVVWKRFAHMSTVAAVHVATIDVNASPFLSGRFFVNTVPVIYHVKDGEFRQYRGSRYEAALIQFVKKELWKNTEPLSAWMKPDTIHMTIMGFCARVSFTLRNIKVRVQEEFGLSTRGSYILVAMGTICVSYALGSLFVCLMDFVNGPSVKSQHQKFNEVQEELVEDMEDLDPTEQIGDDGNIDEQQDSGASEQDTEAEEHYSDTEEHCSETPEEDKLQSEDNDYEDSEAEELLEYKDQAGDSSSWEEEPDTEPEKAKLVGYSGSEKPKKTKKRMLKPRSKTA